MSSNRMLLPAAAKALGVTEYFLRQGVRSGSIPAYRQGGRGRYIIDVTQVDAFLKAKAMENVKQDDDTDDEDNYGRIRRVK